MYQSVFAFFVAFFVLGAAPAAAAKSACLGCHKKYNKSSKVVFHHPVGKKPAKENRLTDAYPLKKGKLACVTCHIDHGDDGEGSPSVAKKGTPYLRTETDDQSLCLLCHEAKTDPHDKLVIDSTIAEQIRAIGGVVAEKLNCRSCHKLHSSSSRELLLALKPPRKRRQPVEVCRLCHQDQKAMEHPLVKTKGSIPSKFKNGNKITLVQKKFLTCSSCHRLHTPADGPKYLAASLESGALCITCHKSSKAVLTTKHNLALNKKDLENSRGATSASGGPCSSCHIMHNAQGQFLWARNAPNATDDIDPLSALCLNCHQDSQVDQHVTRGVSAHPIGADMTGRKMTKKLPLLTVSTKNGTKKVLTCASCHNVHQWNPAKKSAKKPQDIEQDGDATNSFLRIANNSYSKLCLNCHSDKEMLINTVHDLAVSAPKEENINRNTVKKTGTCSACHTVHNSLNLKMWSRILPESIDVSEGFCLSCHNSKGIAFQKTSKGYNHPITTSLVSAGLTTTLPTFDIDGYMKDNTNISCPTCHDVHKWDPAQTQRMMKAPMAEASNATNKFLRASNLDSDLCINCHKQQNFVQGTPHDLRRSAPEEKNIQGTLAAESGPCSACHLVHNAPTPNLWGKELGVGRGIISRRCFSCHQQEKVAQNKAVGLNDHPYDVNLTQDMENLKITLPLFNDDLEVKIDGKLLCSSCHNVHQWTPSNLLMKQITKDREVRVIPDRIIKKGLVGNIAFLQNDFAYIDITTGMTVEANEKLIILKNKTVFATVKVVKINPFAKTFEVFAKILDKSKLADISKGDLILHSRVLSAGKSVDGDANSSFLRSSNSRSELCLECHPEAESVIGTPHDIGVSAPKLKNVKNRTTEQSGPCSACHLTHNGTQIKVFAQKMPKGGRSSVGTNAINKTCLACHQSRLIKGVTKVPPEHHQKTYYTSKHEGDLLYPADGSMPLYLMDGRKVSSLDGGISCATCHSPHRWNPNDASDRMPIAAEGIKPNGDQTSTFLRTSNDGSSLCRKCHIRNVALKMTAMKKTDDDDDDYDDDDDDRDSLADFDIVSSDDGTHIEINSPLDKAIVNNRKTTISGSIEDTTIDHAILLLNGTARQIEVFDGLFSFQGELSEGRNTIKVVATNEIGVSSSSGEIEVMVDTRKPKILEYVYQKPVTVTKNFRIKIVFDMSLSPDSLPAIRLVGSKKSPKMTPLIGSASSKFIMKKASPPVISNWTDALKQGDIKIENTLYGSFEQMPVVAVRDINKSRNPGPNNDQIRIAVLSTAESSTETIFLNESDEEGLFLGKFGFSAWEEEGDRMLYVERRETTSITALYDLSDFDITNIPNDTFVTPGIVLDESMSGDITIIVEEAMGINGVKMDPVATEMFTLDPGMIFIDPENDIVLREAPISRLNKIHIDVSVDEAVATRISESPDFVNSQWHPYKTEETLFITDDSGLKRIYVQFKNKYGDLSEVIKKQTYYIPTDYKTVLKGPIYQDRTLRRVDGPYLIEEDLVIESNATLTMEAGVQILIKKSTDRLIGIIAKGNLVANGTYDRPISFTSNSLVPSNRDWSGITLYSSDSRLYYCNILFAENGILCNSSSPLLDHLVFDQIANTSIVCVNSASPTITFNEIKFSKYGITCEKSSSPRIENNLILMNEVGILCSEFSSPKILNNNISDQEIGIQCDSFSSPPIADNNIVRNRVAGILIDQASPMIYQNNLIENLVGIQCLTDYQPFLIRNNNLHNNTLYGIKLERYTKTILASQNWWGVTQESLIDEYIFDGKDRKGLGFVQFSPFLSGTTVPKNALVNLDVELPTIKDFVAFPVPIRINVPLNMHFLTSESLNQLIHPVITLESENGKSMTLEKPGLFSETLSYNDTYTSSFFKITDKKLSGEVSVYIGGVQDLTGNVMPKTLVTKLFIDPSVILTAGAHVNSRELKLALNAPDYKDYMISNSDSFRGQEWQPIKRKIESELTDVDGQKDIYIKFRSQSHRESKVNHQILWLDRASPRIIGHDIKYPTPSKPFSLRLSFNETVDMSKKPKILLLSSSGETLDVSKGHFSTGEKMVNDTFMTGYHYLEENMGGMISIDIRGVFDLAGNAIVPATMKDIFEYDIVPPTTMAEVSGGPYTNKPDITILFSDIDNPEQMRIRMSQKNDIGEVKWQQFSKQIPFKIVGKPNKKYALYIQLMDSSDNISEVQKIDIYYDIVRPEITSYSYPKPAKITDNFQIAIQFNEALDINNPPKLDLITTGKAKPAVPKGGAFSKTKLENDTYTTPPIVLTKEMGGAITIVVSGTKDLATNTMKLTTKETFNFDTRAPVATDISVLEGTSVVSSNINILLNVVGVKHMRYALNPEFADSNWEEYSEEIAYGLPNNDANYKVYFQFKDTQGNISDTQRVEVRLDREPPQIARYDLSLKTPAPNETFSLNLYFNEEISPERTPSIVLMSTNNASYLVTGEGQFFSTDQNNDTFRTPDIIFGSEMKGAITLIMDNVADRAGNRMPTMIKRIFFFMMADPEKSGISISRGRYTNRRRITVLSKRSGIKKQLLSEDPDFIGAKWRKFKSKTRFMLSETDGEKIIYIRYKDRSNKTLDIETVQIYLDRTAPKIIRYAMPSIGKTNVNRIKVYFSESMSRDLEPTIVLTDSSGTSIKAPAGGEFITTEIANDTYISRRFVDLGHLSGTVTTYISSCEDVSGNSLPLTKSKPFKLRSAVDGQ